MRLSRNRVLLLVGIFVCLLTVVFALAYRSTSVRATTGAFGLSLLALLPLSFISFYVQAPRLAILCGASVRVYSAYVANSVSASLFLVLPGRASEFLKPVVLHLREGLPFSRGIAALVMERAMDAACVAFLAICAIALTAANKVSWEQNGLLMPIFTALGFTCAIALLLKYPQILERLVRAIPWGWVQKNSHDFITAIKGVGRSSTLAFAAGLTLVTWLTSCGNVVVAGMLLGQHPLSPAQALVVFVAGTFGMVITVVPGGLGTFEAATVAALTTFGYEIPDAILFAVALRLATIAPAIPLALWEVSQRWTDLSSMLKTRTRRDADGS